MLLGLTPGRWGFSITVWPLSTAVRRSPFIVMMKRFHWPIGRSAFSFGVTPAGGHPS